MGVFAKESLDRFSVLGAYLGLVEVDPEDELVDSESDEGDGDGGDDGGGDAGRAGTTGGKSRKSYDMKLGGTSGLMVSGNVYGNLMTYINDFTGVAAQPNVAYVDIKVNGFPAIVIVALQDIEAGYHTCPCPLPPPPCPLPPAPCPLPRTPRIVLNSHAS